MVDVDVPNSNQDSFEDEVKGYDYIQDDKDVPNA